MRLTEKTLSQIVNAVLLFGALACIAVGLVLLLCGCAYTHQRLFVGIEQIPILPRIEIENEILFQEPYDEKDMLGVIVGDDRADGRGLL